MKVCSESETSFRIQFEKYTRWRVLLFRYAQKNKTLQDSSKFVCTMDDCAKLKYILSKTNFIESYCRERRNRKCRFYKLTNFKLFATLVKDIPMGCKDAVLPKLQSKITQSIVSRLKRIQDVLKTTFCVFPCSCPQYIRNLPTGRRNFKNSFLSDWTGSTPISSRASTWTTFQLLRSC